MYLRFYNDDFVGVKRRDVLIQQRCRYPISYRCLTTSSHVATRTAAAAAAAAAEASTRHYRVCASVDSCRETVDGRQVACSRTSVAYKVNQ